MQSSDPNITEKSVINIAMDITIKILEKGVSDKDRVRKLVISRLKELDCSASERSLAQRWFKALKKLKQEDRVSHIPEKLYLIIKPLKREIINISSNLKETDDVDIVKLMVQELWQLSIDTYVLYYQEALDIIPTVMKKDVLYYNKDVMRYFLMFIDQILSRYHIKKPIGFESKIDFINEHMDELYKNINCDTSSEIVYTTINHLSRYTDSYIVVDTLFNLVKCLDDNQFMNFENIIAEKLFDVANEIAVNQFDYIQDYIKTYVLSGDEKLKQRASSLNSHKAKYYKGFY